MQLVQGSEHTYLTKNCIINVAASMIFDLPGRKSKTSLPAFLWATLLPFASTSQLPPGQYKASQRILRDGVGVPGIMSRDVYVDH